MLEGLRREFDGNIDVSGPNLAGQFVRQDLVDEYQLVVTRSCSARGCRSGRRSRRHFASGSPRHVSRLRRRTSLVRSVVAAIDLEAAEGSCRWVNDVQGLKSGSPCAGWSRPGRRAPVGRLPRCRAIVSRWRPGAIGYKSETPNEQHAALSASCVQVGGRGCHLGVPSVEWSRLALRDRCTTGSRCSV